MVSIGVSRELPYRPEQLFEIAADVERYPSFVPGWRSARVLQRSENDCVTDQVVGFGPVVQQFRTRTSFHRPDEIRVTSAGGPFDVFQLRWRFNAKPHDRCVVVLDGQIVMRSIPLRVMLSQGANSLADVILNAFESRARQLAAESARRLEPSR